MPRSASTGLPTGSAEPSLAVIVRSLLFDACFWPWTLLMTLAALPWLLLPPWVMVGHARVWLRGVQGLLARIVGLDYDVRGRAHADAAPAIFAFKHQSAWETMAVHLLLHNAAIALKQELTRIPLFGWYLTHAQMIRIDRAGGARALRALVDDARKALERGAPIVIFPEGTRVAPDAHRPYHPGVAALYTRLGCQVVPVALNSGVFWPRRGVIKRPGRIVVEFLPPIAPGLDRRAFMAELERRLEPATERLVAEARGHPVPASPVPGP